MSQKVIITIVIIVIVIGGGLLAWFFLQEEETTTTVNNVNKVTTTNGTTIDLPTGNNVWVMNSDFNPAVLTIQAGETVIWTNKDEAKRKVAAEPHPTSTSLPELVSDELEKGDSFSFTFEEAGEWYYHDYLNPIKKGKIIVE